MSTTNIKLKRSSVKGKAPTTSNIELGEIAINTNDGRLFFKTTDSSATSSIITLRQITGGTGITESLGEISITNTGVVSGVYGSSTEIPVLSINAQGQVDSATTISVAGVSGLSYDSDTNLLTLSTADGGSYAVKLNLQTFSDSDTTDDLNEGSTNLYYTSARADSDAKNAISVTDAGGDGSLTYNSGTGVITYTGPSATEVRAHLVAGGDITYDSASGVISFTERTDQEVRNLFSVSGGLSYDSSTGQFSFTERTDQEVRNLFSVSGDLSYDSSTGQFSIDVEQVYTKANFDSDLGAASTSDLPEGTNLYYTTARFDSDFGDNTTDDLTEGSTNLYYTSARADSDAKNAIEVADAGGDGSLTYNAATGVITYTGPSASETRAHFSAGTGVTISSGQISIGQPVGTTDSAQFQSLGVADSANIGCLHLKKQPTAPNSVAGLLYYDSDPQKGLTFTPTTTELVQDSRINLGQEHVLYVHNISGATINQGDIVYITGVAHGSHPSVARAIANDVTKYKAVGMASQDIPNGNHGYVTQLGIVEGLNTGGLVAGASLFLSADSDGKFVTTPPSGSNYPYQVGWVLTSDSSAGRALIRIATETFDNVRATTNIVADKQIKADSADLNLINLQPDLYTDVDIPNNLPNWPLREGDLFYFSGPDALTYTNKNINVKIGQDDIVRVYNNSGADIAKGKAVYVTGAANDFPSIALAKADTFDTLYNTLGLTSHAIPNGTFGFVTIRGLYGGLDTAGFAVGSRVHISPDSAGELVDYSPTYPDYAYELGTVLIADSATGGNVGGCIQVQPRAELFETIRVQGTQRIGGDLTVEGNLNILGAETKTTVANLNVSDNFIYIGAGDTITTSYVSGGTGVNDATFKDYYEGDSDKYYFVQIFDADSANGGDIIKWGLGDSADAINQGGFTYLNFDSDGGPSTHDLSVDRTLVSLRYNIKVTFETAGGHDSGDYWYGLASPVNQDLGIVGNYNTPDAPYTHAGFFRDASDQKFKVFNKYDPEVEGNINTSDSSFELGIMQASSFEGNLTGNVTGNANTATLLQTARNFSLSGEVTAADQSFDGGANVTLSTVIASGVIDNDNIAGAAGIVDTKLATISTAGKVQNSATSATSANTASTIVLRDGSGDFNAGAVRLTDLHVGNLHVDSADIISLVQANSINNVVEDTSPQLGGNLDLNSNDITGTGNISTSGSLTLSSTDDTSTAGPDLELYRNSPTPADGDYLGQLRFTGENSTGGSVLYAKMTGKISDVSSGTEDGLIEVAVKSNGVNTIMARFTGSSLNILNGAGLDVDGNITTNGTIDGRDVAADGSKLDGIESGATADQTAAEIMTLLKTVDSNGSGLNADTLDGQQGTYYRINVYNSSGTLVN